MIYILEDDDSIRKLVTYALESQGIATQGFASPTPFREAMQTQIPSLLLLDLMLPEESGLEILKQLRSDPRTARLPVIILTAKGAEYDRVEGLDAGADDYVTKPFGMMELLARVRALLRRAEVGSELRFGELHIFPERYEVLVGGKPVVLTNKEFRLLLLLAENEGVVMTREVLMDRIWDLGTEPENRTLDVHIRKVRAKLGDAGSYIETVRGVGYRFKV
jgi:two-component system alkaline phosphatase synthesis response regulator PhoP